MAGILFLALFTPTGIRKYLQKSSWETSNIFLYEPKPKLLK